MEFENTQKRFLQKLPKHAIIFDFGCGAGRDAIYFLSHGFQVEAIGGSVELCKIASVYTGIAITLSSSPIGKCKMDEQAQVPSYLLLSFNS